MKKESVIILILLLIPGAIAAGVSYSSTPLKIAPGQTEDVPVNLQNMMGDQPITLAITWLEGEEIAEIIGETTYTLQPKTEVNFKIRVTIPSDAKPGDSYNLKLRAGSAPAGGKEIELTTGYIIEKPIQIVAESELPEAISTPPTPADETPPETGTEIPQMNKALYGVIAVIIIALIVLIIILMRRKK